MAKKPTLEHTEMLLARAKTRLKLAFGRVEKLEKQRKRLAKASETPIFLKHVKAAERCCSPRAGLHGDENPRAGAADDQAAS